MNPDAGLMACLAGLAFSAPVGAAPGRGLPSGAACEVNKECASGVCSSGVCGASAASAAEDLRAALKAYQRSDFEGVVKLLSPLLSPRDRFARSEQSVQARKLLGVSYVFEKKRAAAEEQFLTILIERPTFSLDPLVYPNSVVKIFDEVKKRNVRLISAILARERREQAARRKAALRRQAEKRRLTEQASRARVIERTINERPYWINFVPLGAGQFQNGHRTKGIVLMAAQLGLGAVALGTAMGVAYGFRRDPWVAAGDVDTATALNIVSISSGALGLALVAYGIIDALIYHEPRTVRERQYRKHKKPGAAKSAWLLTPAISHEAASLQLKLVF